MSTRSLEFRRLAQALMRQRGLWWMAVVVWTVILWNLSANRALPSGPEFPLKDKVMHCGYFGLGSGCFLIACFGRAKPTLQKLFMAGFLFAALIGAADEYHQTFTPGRSGNDPWDWLADVSGGLLAAWVSHRLLFKTLDSAATR